MWGACIINKQTKMETIEVGQFEIEVDWQEITEIPWDLSEEKMLNDEGEIIEASMEADWEQNFKFVNTQKAKKKVRKKPSVILRI